MRRHGGHRGRGVRTPGALEPAYLNLDWALATPVLSSAQILSALSLICSQASPPALPSSFIFSDAARCLARNPRSSSAALTLTSAAAFAALASSRLISALHSFSCAPSFCLYAS